MFVLLQGNYIILWWHRISCEVMCQKWICHKDLFIAQWSEVLLNNTCRLTCQYLNSQVVASMFWCLKGMHLHGILASPPWEQQIAVTFFSLFWDDSFSSPVPWSATKTRKGSGVFHCPPKFLVHFCFRFVRKILQNQLYPTCGCCNKFWKNSFFIFYFFDE